MEWIERIFLTIMVILFFVMILFAVQELRCGQKCLDVGVDEHRVTGIPPICYCDKGGWKRSGCFDDDNKIKC